MGIKNIGNSPSETVEKEYKRFNLETVELPDATGCGKCCHLRYSITKNCMKNYFKDFN
jgi:hypothetical protein